MITMVGVSSIVYLKQHGRQEHTIHVWYEFAKIALLLKSYCIKQKHSIYDTHTFHEI